ncbi:MAG: diaminopimelate epimerase [Rhodospirillales bacterium]|nr:diaminopimelate epimerase [Rhodospirillales bacterium]
MAAAIQPKDREPRSVTAPQAGVPFIKMHGLGNDFVVVDARERPFVLDPVRARAIADRRTGIGCDQLIVIEPPQSQGADIFMRILNADGGEVAACGNGTRCVANFVMGGIGRDRLVIETAAGLLDCERSDDGRVAVDMGPARHDWRDIPLATAQDTLHVDLALGPLSDPVAVNMGNPHAVFFVADVAAIDLAKYGPVLETHSLFPERANIGVAQVLASDRLRLRVWERGAGITSACGSGACAALVAAARRGLTGRRTTVIVDGGELEIEWLKDDHVLMTGPVAISFAGVIPGS